MLGQGQAHLGAVHGEGAGELAAHVHELANVGELLAHHAVVWRADDGAAQVFLGLLQVCLAGGQPGDGLLQLGFAQGEVRGVAFGDVQAAQPFPVLFRIAGAGFLGGHLGAGPRHFGFRPLQVRLVDAGVDAHQHVALLEDATAHECRRHLDDLPGHFRDQRGFRAWRDGALGGDGEGDRLAFQRGDADEQRRFRHWLLRGRRPALHQPERDGARDQ